MLTEGTTLTVGNHDVKVVRYLSEGGFSKIYQVVMDPAEGGTEIGCLKQVLVPDKNGLNTLRKEVDVMKTLKNARSIVKYYDSNAERLPDGSYQVLVLMELCPNKSLLDFMNDRIRLKLTEPEILKIMLDISIGVYEMHKIKLVHRDIKIENVLIDAKKSFKLCDFGSVSSPIRPPQHQQEFQLLGHDILYHTTPQYRSPEMIDLYRGFPIDERSDIWALGCFLYKLCYYTTPFEANGDIAILHASFQFPPAPIYSGDLKNLIIIMLQENPLYRPNIVQILMLVAKLMGTDYKALDIEDFYGAGEYNFQALHEMQREKHNQLLKQQQYYLEQQKQQQAYELSKQQQALSKSSLRVSLQHLSRESSVHAKGTETPVSSVKVEPDVLTKDPLMVVIDDGLTNPDKKPEIPVQPVKSANSTSNALDIDNESSDSVDLEVDLPELDHIAERYPCLDDIDNVVSDDGAELRRTSSLFKARSSMDTNGYESALESVISRDLSGLQPISNVKSRTDLELVDAWKKDGTSKFDERAEKLADEIFSVGSDKPQRTKSTTRPDPSKDLTLGTSIEDPRSKTLILGVQGTQFHGSVPKPVHKEQTLDDFKMPQIAPSLHLPKSRQDNTNSAINPVNTKTEGSDLDARIGKHSTPNTEFSPAPKNYDNLHLDYPRPEVKRGSSNPWGKALNSPTIDAQKNVSQDTGLNLHKHMSNLDLDAHFEAARKRSTEANLIDLEGLSISAPSSQKVDQVVKQEPIEVAGPNPARSIVESSLIDMDFDGGKHEDSKPTFRKRGSDMQTQPLNFEEKVIDFASDDENHNSEMNRVAIRNSLKKSRKHSSDRRGETNHVDGKKRLSFFGGSSD